MTDTIAITEKDGWLHDERGNRNQIAWHGSREAAEAALRSLVDCDNCVNCSRCSRCSRCSGCSDCSDCSRCSGCSGVAYQYDKQNVVAAEAGTTADAIPAIPTIPVISDIHKAVYEAVSRPNALDMGSWHTCDTTHCRAGWVVHLAGEAGYKLEEFHNTELAAMLIYRESGYPINPARFHDSGKVAMDDMRRLAEGGDEPA